MIKIVIFIITTIPLPYSKIIITKGPSSEGYKVSVCGPDT